DKDEHYIFECTGLQRLQQKSVIKKDTEKEYRKISKKEFVKQDKAFFEDPASSLKDKLDGTMHFFPSNPAQTQTAFIRKYNPIELEE
ncbi:MAG: hypothetical protein LBL90_05815, partial [Prevotellaceae bacterium]|nr:hypothetical protein [Prevotellaceae bacterium]